MALSYPQIRSQVQQQHLQQKQETEMLSRLGPRIEIRELSPMKIVFLLSNVDLSLANCLRRILIAEVPTLAIEFAEVNENTSVLDDEFLSHRLGLIPIDSKTVLDYKLREQCTCQKECHSCSVTYTLKAECPMKVPEGYTTVTHWDIVPAPQESSRDCPLPMPRPPSDNPQGPSEGITIVKLAPGQKIDFRLVANRGMGKVHAKFMATGTVAMQTMPSVEVDHQKLISSSVREKQEIAASCPTKVFDVKEEMGGKGELVVTNHEACTFCSECVVKCKQLGFPDAVVIKEVPREFIFSVESTGSLDAALIVEIAIKELNKKLHLLQTSLAATNNSLQK
eukprot:Platyproteum_vivax@DN2328_c0_g1_i1.p1